MPFFYVFTVLFLAVAVVAQPVKTVIAGAQDIAALSMAEMSGDDRFELLERDSVQLSADELKFANTALTQIELAAKYPHAELFALIRQDSGGKLQLVVFHSRRGYRFAVAELPEQPEAASQIVRQRLLEAVEVLEGAGKRTISIAAVRLVGLSPEERRSVERLIPELENSILRDGEFYLLEREELSRVVQEQWLTDLSFAVAPANVQLRMEFSPLDEPGKIRLVLRATDCSGDVLAEKLIDDIRSVDWQHYRVLPDAIPELAPDFEKEAAALAREAQFLRERNIDYLRQFRLLSAATVLNPDECGYQTDLLFAASVVASSRPKLREAGFYQECEFILDMAEQIRKKFPQSEPAFCLRSLPEAFVLAFGEPPDAGTPPELQARGRVIMQRLRTFYTAAARRQLKAAHAHRTPEAEAAYEAYRECFTLKNPCFYYDIREQFELQCVADMTAFLRWQQMLPDEERVPMSEFEQLYLDARMLASADRVLQYQPEAVELLLADTHRDFRGLGELLQWYRSFSASGEADGLRQAIGIWQEAHYQVNYSGWCGNFVLAMLSPKDASVKRESKTPPAPAPEEPGAPWSLTEWQVPPGSTEKIQIIDSCADDDYLYLLQQFGELYRIPLAGGKAQLIASHLSLNVEVMATDGRYLVLGRNNSSKGEYFATAIIYDLETLQSWELENFPEHRFTSIAVLHDRLYLAGRAEMISCDIYGNARRLELSNRREVPENEVEKIPQYTISSCYPVPLLNALIVRVNERIYFYEPLQRRWRELDKICMSIILPPRGNEMIYERPGVGIYRIVLPDGEPELLINAGEREIAGVPQIRVGGLVAYTPASVWYHKYVASINSDGVASWYELPPKDNGSSYLCPDGHSVVRVSPNRLFQLSVLPR